MCDYEDCENKAKYLDSMDNRVCEECMVRETEQNGDLPEEFEEIKQRGK